MNASDHVSYTTPHPSGIAYKSVLTNALSPHEFIQISRQHTCISANSLYGLQLCLDSIPEGFNPLWADTGSSFWLFISGVSYNLHWFFSAKYTTPWGGGGGGSYNLHEDQCFNTEYYSSLALSLPKWRTSKTYINPGTVQRNLKVWKFSMSAF